ncbi:MAG: 3-methyl-2-oxobutanoate dehydrogenase subunit VorB [Thermodesulfobacteriota bacterium]|nr:3-methyl-2-oxobutanoate dehydrogenase subunit VorB [Thermodesulfobacteriota bacterium]
MEKRLFLRGNHALAIGAIKAGCRFYFGYPITPQNDIPEFFSKQMVKVEGCFIQAESEVASINMILGASAAGARAMTSSSSPGLSLMQEGLSYLAGSELPAVVVNINRSGPGLGGISASQGDYFQATRGGGHGDYRTLVLAPSSVQEMHDLTLLAFDLADKYRNPVIILADAVLGQIQETMVDRPYQPLELPPKDWILAGASGRDPRLIKSLYLKEGEMERHNWKLFEKYQRMKREDVRHENYLEEEAELIIVSFGTAARVAKSAIRLARAEGLKVGLFRPITLFPFPEKALFDLSQRVKRFLTIEMNTGQMVEDVKLSVARDADVHFYGHAPGSPPAPEELLNALKKVY